MSVKYYEEYCYFRDHIHLFFHKTKHYNARYVNSWSDTSTSVINTSEDDASGIRMAIRQQKKADGLTQASEDTEIEVQAEHLEAMQNELSFTEEPRARDREDEISHHGIFDDSGENNNGRTRRRSTG